MEETNFSVVATGCGGEFIAAACWKGQEERGIGKRLIGSISRAPSLRVMPSKQHFAGAHPFAERTQWWRKVEVTKVTRALFEKAKGREG